MIWMIRHAQSLSNAGAKTSDFLAIELTEFGHDQANRLAQTFPNAPDRIVCSPYIRARQTAVPTIARFPDVPVLERQVQEFTYLDSAACQDTCPADRLPMVESYWSRLDPNHHEGPQAESFADFVGRINTFLAEARTWPGETLVFSHEQFLRGVILAHLLQSLHGDARDMSHFFHFRSTFPIPNTARYALDFDSGTSRLGPIQVLA